MSEIRQRKPPSQSSDEIELPTYAPQPSSPKTTGRDGLFKTNSETEIIHPEPEYTQKTLSSSPDFQCLLVDNSNWVNLSLSTSSNFNTPLFYICNSQFSPSKPSVTIRAGSKTGETRGVLNLLWSRDNVFAVGDPDSSMGGLAWENLRRTSKWTHATYEFEYVVEGRRRRFVWQRTRQPVFADQPDLEMREVGGDVSGGGKVLAVYKGCQGWVSKKRGEFYVRRQEKEEVWGDWEIVVLLTGMGIVEGARRRARQRRSG